MPEFKIFYGIKISVINNYIFQHSQEIFKLILVNALD